MENHYLALGQQHLSAGDWVEAIRALAWAKDIEPDRAAIYLALIDAYEKAAEAEGEPDLLHQAFNVCRDLRDRRLPMTAEQRGDFYRAFIRIRDSVIAARRTGWRPPPPKERVRELLGKPQER